MTSMIHAPFSLVKAPSDTTAVVDPFEKKLILKIGDEDTVIDVEELSAYMTSLGKCSSSPIIGGDRAGKDGEKPKKHQVLIDLKTKNMHIRHEGVNVVISSEKVVDLVII